MKCASLSLAAVALVLVSVACERRVPQTESVSPAKPVQQSSETDATPPPAIKVDPFAPKFFAPAPVRP